MTAGGQQRFAEALALHQQGQLPLAEILYREVLRTAPGHAQALAMLGLVEAAKGRIDEAVVMLQQSLRAEPGNASALFNLGLLHQQAGRVAEALDCFDRTQALGVDNPQLHKRRGVALHQSGRYGDALVAYERALALHPRDPDALNNAGMALHKLRRYPEAIAHYQRSLELDAGSAETEMNLGVVLYELKRFDEARARHERALALRPGNLDAQVNLANTLLELGQHAQALDLYRRVADLRPGDQDVQMNLGNVLREMHRYDEALACYERAGALDPECADVHWNHALALLAMGDLARGWREHEWRLRMPAMFDTQRQFHAPAWQGDAPLAGRTILLHAEQGLGDTLQFCRYAAVLQAGGAKVRLEVQKPLVPVLRDQPGLGEVVERGTDAGGYDFHCALLSLPFACGTHLGNVPASVPYVRADPELLQRWRKEMDSARRPRIGLAWSGNPVHPNDYRRSIPFALLLGGLPGGASYWSLQKEVTPEDARLIAADGRIQRFDENAFEHTAAQIALLDAVVCVDTSIGHLAGALGARTFLLLAHTADWRWLSNREDTPWYPRHTLLRQARPGEWEPVLRRLAGEIGALAQAQIRPSSTA